MICGLFMTCDALNRVTGAKNNIDKDALNKKLDERLYDRLDHVQQLLVGPVVLPPITLGEILTFWKIQCKS